MKFTEAVNVTGDKEKKKSLKGKWILKKVQYSDNFSNSVEIPNVESNAGTAVSFLEQFIITINMMRNDISMLCY